MSKELKLIGIIIIIIIFCGLIYVLEKKGIYPKAPDNLYIKMKEINDNKCLIGLSKEEVVELLGEPRYEYNDRKNKKAYTFSAGKIVNKSLFGNTNGQNCYELNVFFDENDKVEYTYIKLST